ncbi:MAG: ATP synthase F1 subunit delta [Acidobacteria bacterium]|nr:MAG: ATP synthase F1 subunit delta [Acidobacteriota bacterium]
MSNRSSAARYARALLDVSRVEADPEVAEQELAGFVSLVGSNETLARVLTSPGVPVPRKSALVAELVGRLRPSRPVARILALLAERDRLVLLPDLLEEYSRRLMDYRQVIRADVTTAVALPAERLEALRQTIAEKTGRTVILTTAVDPGLIGGLVTRIGSVVYDGSVRRQLERIRETLTA